MANYCECEDWKVNMPKMDGIFGFANIHSLRYEGKVFKYCPWCRSLLKSGRACEVCFAEPWEECKEEHTKLSAEQENVQLVLGRVVKAIPIKAALKRYYAEKGHSWEFLEVLVLGLNEEAGEVAAATLDKSPTFDPKPDRVKSDLEYELWDCLEYIAAIAVCAEIDLPLYISEEAEEEHFK